MEMGSFSEEKTHPCGVLSTLVRMTDADYPKNGRKDTLGTNAMKMKASNLLGRQPDTGCTWQPCQRGLPEQRERIVLLNDYTFQSAMR